MKNLEETLVEASARRDILALQAANTAEEQYKVEWQQAVERRDEYGRDGVRHQRFLSGMQEKKGHSVP